MVNGELEYNALALLVQKWSYVGRVSFFCKAKKRNPTYMTLQKNVTRHLSTSLSHRIEFSGKCRVTFFCDAI